jgi:DHA2 family methylenomycin A resistance protein-like MFS transporter
MIAVGALAYAVIEGPQSGWTAPLILSLAVVTVLAVNAFIVYEANGADPMRVLMLFRDRT